MAQFDKFDICEAHYVFAMLWHGGQGSDEYRKLGQLHHMGFRPRFRLSNEDDLTENGREIYDNLVSKLED